MRVHYVTLTVPIMGDWWGEYKYKYTTLRYEYYLCAYTYMIMNDHESYMSIHIYRNHSASQNCLPKMTRNFCQAYHPFRSHVLQLFSSGIIDTLTEAETAAEDQNVPGLKGRKMVDHDKTWGYLGEEKLNLWHPHKRQPKTKATFSFLSTGLGNTLWNKGRTSIRDIPLKIPWLVSQAPPLIYRIYRTSRHILPEIPMLGIC